MSTVHAPPGPCQSFADHYWRALTHEGLPTSNTLPCFQSPSGRGRLLESDTQGKPDHDTGLMKDPGAGGAINHMPPIQTTHRFHAKFCRLVMLCYPKLGTYLHQHFCRQSQ